MAVPFTEGEVGEKMTCPICERDCEEWYGSEPEDDEEFGKLEEKLGNVANWLVCAGCLETMEKLLDCEIRLTSAEEAAELSDQLYHEGVSKIVPKKALEYVAVIHENRCPICKKHVETEFEYLTESKEWGTLTPFRSMTLSCGSCGFALRKTSSQPDEPLGYLVVGTILDFNDELLFVEVISPPNVDQLKGLRIQDEKNLVLENRCDPVVLETYKRLGELVEILVIENKAVRVEG